MNFSLKKQLKCKLLIGAMLLANCLSGVAFSQELPKLMVGDPAPAFTYSKWIQGANPIKELEKDKLYVIEFWATWCGPCIAAMPHLSELAKQYEGKIDFIGCDVWESKHGGPKEQESYTKKVTTFVADQYKSGRLTYNVVMDNNAEDMANSWLTPAGQNGIPASFVVEKGRIAWIGHPHYLDSILTAISLGKFDVQAERERKVKRLQEAAKREAGPTAAIKAYKAAEEAKKYDEALRLMDETLVKYPDMKHRFVSDKFLLLMDHYSVDKALAYAKEFSDEKLPAQVLVGNLLMKDSLPKPVVEFSITQIHKWMTDDNPKIYDVLASFQAKGGQYAEAAKSLRKAVEIGKSLKDRSFFTDSVLEGYSKKAEEYEQKARQQK